MPPLAGGFFMVRCRLGILFCIDFIGKGPICETNGNFLSLRTHQTKIPPNLLGDFFYFLKGEKKWQTAKKNKPYESNSKKNFHINGRFAKKVAFQEEWGDGHDKRNPNRKARQGKTANNIF